MPDRFAIYFTLDASDPIYQLASRWLKYDVWSGDILDQSSCSFLEGTQSDYSDVITSPSQYGFHATLKPPFRLNDNENIIGLDRALTNFAEQTMPFQCKPLSIQRVGKFLALRPRELCPKLDQLAEQCVKTFDHFRVPLNEFEIAKRKPDQLSEKQRKYLNRWGYPFVCEEFRFHMTLTNKLCDQELEELEITLASGFSPLLGKPLKVRTIFLCHQSDLDQKFKIIKQYSLRKQL